MDVQDVSVSVCVRVCVCVHVICLQCVYLYFIYRYVRPSEPTGINNNETMIIDDVRIRRIITTGGNFKPRPSENSETASAGRARANFPAHDYRRARCLLLLLGTYYCFILFYVLRSITAFRTDNPLLH